MKQGRCSNFGNCSKADSGEIIEVDDFDDFVCPECGQDLQVSVQPLTAPNKKTKKAEKAPKNPSESKGKNTKLFIIIGAVVAVGIITAIVLALLDGKKESSVAMAYQTENAADDDLDVDDLDMYKDEDSDHPFDTEDEVAAFDEVQDVEEVPATPVVSEEYVGVMPESPKKEEVAPARKPKEPSSHPLSYGTWTGGMKNGKPHGAGTMTYSASRVIDDRDSKGRVAEPGEYVVGEWDNGHLVQGRWFKNDGSKEAIIIGKAG